ncbi:MAG: hypothetical protein OEY38_07205 [Gammaproteobacteria bacterium]|nr:hypothetical protein [Gammaproteobacteria bacterium]
MMTHRYTCKLFFSAIALVSLIFGLVLYISSRDTSQMLIFSWLPWISFKPIWPAGNSYFSPIVNSLPSFFHYVFVSSLVLALFAPLSQSKMKQILWLALFFCSLLEVFQAIPYPLGHASTLTSWFSWFYLGEFDFLDLLMIALGFISLWFTVVVLAQKQYRASLGYIQFKSPLAIIVLTSLATFFSLGSTVPCYEDLDCQGASARPVYLSYEDLRNAIAARDKTELEDPGKILTYNNYLFINSINQGVHIYDNTDPSQPTHKLFINIPGNLDISVADDVLYADSFIDLVAISINDLAQIEVTKRIKDVFPYDAYQVIGDDVYLGDVDQSQGVVIGYEQTNLEGY